MSELLLPLKANLTLSVMYREETLLAEVKKNLEQLYGKIDMISDSYCFSDISPYYNPEMGEKINKIIFSFEKTIEKSALADVKVKSVEIENSYSVNGLRQLNLDPGLITLENFILATGKNFSHRIYLKNGVYAEVTLMFGKKGLIKELPWTYRDYLFEPAKSFLLNVRELYRVKRAELLKESGDKIESDTIPPQT
ncbi:MAG: DUF4416 family protein [bacterium]